MAAGETNRSFDGYKVIDRAFPDSFVRRDFMTASDARAYDGALAAATDEYVMQHFLEAHPCFLVQNLAGGAGAWVIPQARLGADFVTDFLIAEIDYGRPVWYVVELERPQSRIFTKKGDPSSALTHAVRQIEDWRNWLSRNLDYASRPRHQAGLGLAEIEPGVEGLIIMGREHDIDATNNDFRRLSLERAHGVKIRTYDWLADLAEKNLAGLRARPDMVIPSQRNPFDDIMGGLGTTHRQLDLTTLAINNSFGGIFSTWANPSAVREIEYEGITFSLYGNSDEVNVPLSTVRAHPTGQPLELSDWRDWVDHVTRDIGTDFSLLVSERLPAEALQNALTQERDGVWREVNNLDAHASGQEQSWFGRFDVLVHVSFDGSYTDRVNRLRGAREIFHQHIALQHDSALDREAEVQVRIASLAISQGDIVTHAAFGTGTVLSISGSGSNTSAIIDFGIEYGTKNLALGYAPIKKKL